MFLYSQRLVQRVHHHERLNIMVDVGFILSKKIFKNKPNL